MIELVQNNFHDALQCWSTDNMPVSTGWMTECISVIFIGKETHYGIHCGGGLNKDIAMKLKEMLPKNFEVQRTFIVFGSCYFNNPHSCVFSVKDAYTCFGNDCVVLCSNEAFIISKDKFKAQYNWDINTNNWRKL